MPLPHLHIRRARSNDLFQLAVLAADVFCQTYGAVIPPDILQPFLQQHFSPSALIKDIALPHHHYLVAYDKERLAGFCKLAVTAVPPTITTHNPLELVKLYLHPDYHGTGTGSQLMKYAIETAVHHNHDALWLCVWEQNTHAIAFYNKWGYKQVDTTQIFVGSVVFDDLVLIKTL